jgi:hypothetical protein
LLPDDARHGLPDDDVRKRRGSRASSVGAALGGGREIVRRFGGRRVRERVRGERERGEVGK